MRLLADFEFDRLGVFTYSEEEGTRSARMEPRVPEATAEWRRRLLLDMQAEILAARQEQRVGTVVNALVESHEPDGFWGRTDADAPGVDCGIRIRGEVQVGDVVTARCTATRGVDLLGECT